MTISKQESMLFGGWAKLQTPLQIEIGASKISDIVSLSTSKQNTSIVLRLYKNNLVHPIGISIANLPGAEYGTTYREYSIEEIDEDSNNFVSSFLQKLFMQMAFVRYFELWYQNGLYHKYFIRGIKGGKKAEKSFAGIIGALNKSVFLKINNKWEILDEKKLYPEIKRMQKATIDSVREFVRKQK